MTNLTRSGARFVLLSGQSFLATLGLTIFFHEWVALREEFAFAIVLIVTTGVNFLLLRYFVYPGVHGGMARQFGLFVASSAGFRGIEYSLFLFLHAWLSFPYRVVVVAVLGLTFTVKFFYYGSVVFTRRRLEFSRA